MTEPFFYEHNHRLQQTLKDQKVLVHLRISLTICDCPKLHSREHLTKQDLEVHIDLMKQY